MVERRRDAPNPAVPTESGQLGWDAPTARCQSAAATLLFHPCMQPTTRRFRTTQPSRHLTWSTLALWETARQARFQFAGTQTALLRTWMDQCSLPPTAERWCALAAAVLQVAAPQAVSLILPPSRSSAPADSSVSFQKAIDAASAQAAQGVAVVIPEGKRPACTCAAPNDLHSPAGTLAWLTECRASLVHCRSNY